jgi:hypothetical protein
MEKPTLARNGQLFKAAWQRSIEENIRIELADIVKKKTEEAYREMNKKMLETVANIQARLILNENADTFSGTVSMQLILPREMTVNPPDA